MCHLRRKMIGCGHSRNADQQSGLSNLVRDLLRQNASGATAFGNCSRCMLTAASLETRAAVKACKVRWRMNPFNPLEQLTTFEVICNTFCQPQRCFHSRQAVKDLRYKFKIIRVHSTITFPSSSPAKSSLPRNTRDFAVPTAHDCASAISS